MPPSTEPLVLIVELIHIYFILSRYYILPESEVDIVAKLDRNSQCSTLAYTRNLPLRLYLGKREENLY